MQSAICIVVDRLHAAYLSCYGNAWISTPGFDRLAAGSFVFDQALITSPELEQLYGSYWHGRHPLEEPVNGADSLPRRLAGLGVRTALITDEPLLAVAPIATSVQEVVHIRAPAAVENAATTDETWLAAVFAGAIDWLASAQPPFLLWVHVSSLGKTWDAPLELRNQYADADDPLPPPIIVPPRLVLDESYDPDELLGHSLAYAGQVTALDACLTGLLDWLADRPWWAETLFSFKSARGIALGEHRRIGCWDEAMCGELLQVPWFLRLPDGVGRAARSQALVEPGDLCLTLAEHWQLPQPPANSRMAHSLLPLLDDRTFALRDRICSVASSGERAIRTPAWFMRWASSQPAPGDDPIAKHWLYAKPDDRFEMNDVADRCPEIIEALERAWDETAHAARSADVKLAPLAYELIAAHG